MDRKHIMNEKKADKEQEQGCLIATALFSDLFSTTLDAVNHHLHKPQTPKQKKHLCTFTNSWVSVSKTWKKMKRHLLIY